VYTIEISPGNGESVFSEALSILEREHVAERIWEKDYTLWSSEPAEITDRLGWLTVIDSMRAQIPILEALSKEIRRADILDVVLLGMGGSSLGAEVLNRVLGSAPGHPRLTVLDSTIPEAVASVRESIDLARALFLVSSKSGTTSETRALFDYFRAAESDTRKNNTGGHFVAITDSGTPLAKLAYEQGFRRVFENPEDIGGRYSVLSLFGLVPAALIGVDIKRLLDAADAMRKRCGPGLPADKNEGCQLGAYLGALANCNRDKVTIITSPSLDSFGLWVEQLIAESTGKSGRGMIPVVGEPLVDTGLYGGDRLFVYVRLKDDDNTAVDSFVRAVRAKGYPLAVLEIKDRWELGAIFYLWEFAVAVAGMLIGIHPFNQPDVQRTKEATRRILNEYANSGKLPSSQVGNSLSDLLSQAREGDYFAIMAYLEQTAKADREFERLRRSVLKSHHLATTIGYGPRFLHSTGQLHKGGPDKGLFLQVVAKHDRDVPIPLREYSFGTMSEAESLGDLEALQSLGRRVIRVSLDELVMQMK
jgi:glucose-6-phosphate isomerase